MRNLHNVRKVPVLKLTHVGCASLIAPTFDVQSRSLFDAECLQLAKTEAGAI